MPDPTAQPDYQAALAEIGRRIAASLAGTPPHALPIRMVIAGGTALHWHTGDRISKDVDAAFSHRIALPDGLDIACRMLANRYPPRHWASPSVPCATSLRSRGSTEAAPRRRRRNCRKRSHSDETALAARAGPAEKRDLPLQKKNRLPLVLPWHASCVITLARAGPHGCRRTRPARGAARGHTQPTLGETP